MSAEQGLAVATYAFYSGADISENGNEILRAIEQAAANNLRLLAVPECALSGYPGAGRDNFDGLNLCELGDWEDRLHTAAQQAGIALALGTIGIHPQQNGASPTSAPEQISCDHSGAALPALANEILWCGDVERSCRYRKRALTPLDEHHFMPGTDAVVVDLDGWKLGLMICFDIRFPHIAADCALAGADGFVHIAHMAGPDLHPGTKEQVIPAFMSVRAAEFASPIVSCNTAAEDRWIGSGVWDGRGINTAITDTGFLQAELPPRTTLGDWYEGLRSLSLERWQTLSSPAD